MFLGLEFDALGFESGMLRLRQYRSVLGLMVQCLGLWLRVDDRAGKMILEALRCFTCHTDAGQPGQAYRQTNCS